MLENFNVHATIPVTDLMIAKQFYEQVLGLRQIEENPSGIYYRCGISKIRIYVSGAAGTNRGSSAAWDVQRDELDLLVEGLRMKGVIFEHYDTIPDVKRHGDIHEVGVLRVAWFKDPFGNLLSIGNTG